MLTNSSRTSRSLIALSLVLLMSFCMISTNKITPTVRAGGDQTCSPSQTHHLTKESGNSVNPPCDPDTEVTFLDTNTNTFVPALVVDPNTKFFPYDVIPTTNWVAMTCDRMGADNTVFTYRTLFNLPECFANPSISVQVHSDNAANIFLNGNLIGGQPDVEDAANFQNPPEVFANNTATFFQAGQNILEFKVHNFGAQITALDFLADICFADCVVQTCRTCDEGVVVVDSNVTVDLNPAVPTCSGDPDLCAFLTFDKSGPSPATWKAIFNLGAKKLLVKNGATITVKPGPPNGGNNKESPGIEISTTCDIEVEAGGVIAVQSINQQAGDIVIKANGNIVINGTVSDSVIGTNGRPGDVTIASCCGSITTGPFSLIETSGVDHGGSDINLLTCGGTGSGDIVINGLVDASYKGAIASTINIASFAGAVTIDGNNFQGIEAGTKRRITSGVTVRSKRDPLAGKINIQANNDITVLGNAILAKLYPNYGAVAVKPASTNGSSGDGAITAVSVNGRIVAKDRAFDIANRFNALNDITLSAAGNIELSVTGSMDDGAATNAKPVVNSQGGSAGKGGINRLRSHTGGINIGLNAQVLANFVGTPGSNGANFLVSCLGINNLGTVLPADTNNADDSGVCAPPSPTPLFTGCDQFNVGCGNRNPPGQ